MIVRLIKLLLILITATLLVACGPVKMPVVSSYAISNMQSLRAVKGSRTRLTLLVSVPVASPGYQSSNMIYVNIPYRLRSYANNQWVAPPASMLLPLLAQRIRVTGYFRAVLTPPFSGITNYRVDTQLLTLQQEFIKPVSDVRLVMQATIVNNSTSRVIASRRFQALVPAPGNDPYSGVLATNKAAASVTRQITRFVLRSIR